MSRSGISSPDELLFNSGGCIKSEKQKQPKVHEVCTVNWCGSLLWKSFFWKKYTETMLSIGCRCSLSLIRWKFKVGPEGLYSNAHEYAYCQLFLTASAL